MLCKWTEALISVLDKGQLRMEICWRLKRWTSVDHVPGTMSKKLIMFNYIMNLTEISRSQFISAKKLPPQWVFAFSDASQGNIVITLI